MSKMFSVVTLASDSRQMPPSIRETAVELW